MERRSNGRGRCRYLRDGAVGAGDKGGGGPVRERVSTGVSARVSGVMIVALSTGGGGGGRVSVCVSADAGWLGTVFVGEGADGGGRCESVTPGEDAGGGDGRGVLCV